MRRLKGDDWKSTSNGNSLVAYPTASTVLQQRAVMSYPLLHLNPIMQETPYTEFFYLTPYWGVRWDDSL